MKKVAGVQFPGNLKHYFFFTDIDNLQVGDILVVDTANGLQIVKFVEYRSLDDIIQKPTKWVVQKVDLTKHRERMEAIERAEKLKRMMEERRKQAQELEIYAILAKSDPEMAKLLDEYKKLQEVL